MMSASHCNLEKWLNDYVSSSGHQTPDETKFNNALQELTTDGIFKLVSSTRNTMFQYTVVHWAAINDHAWIFRSILSSLKVEQRFDLLSLKSMKIGFAALHLIGYYGSTSSLQCILNLVPPEERCQLMSALSYEGSTPVLYAAWMGQTEVMRSMLEILTPTERFHILKVQNITGNTAVHDIAQQGDTQTLKCVMDFLHPTVQSKLLEIRNLDNQTPLEFAEYREHHYAADFIRQCIEVTERHLIELPETGRDDAVQTGLLQRVQDMKEKERQLVNVVAERSVQNRQLTNELLRAKEELANKKEEENTKVAELKEQLARKGTEMQEAYNKMHSILKQQMQGVIHRKDTDTNNSAQVEVYQKKKAKVASRCEERVESTEHRMDSLKLPAAVEETVMSESSCLEPVETTGTIEEGQLSITTTAMQVESESL